MIQTRPDPWKFARGGAVSRISLWLLQTAVIAAVVEFVARGLGADVRVVGPGSDHTLLGVIAFFSALFVMSRSDRGVGPYGLAIGDTWSKRLSIGLAIGAAILVVTTILAIFFGAWQAHVAPAGRWISSFGKAFGAIPMAVAATLTFAGFVAGAAREHWGRIPAVFIAAALFGGFSLLHPVGPLGGSDWSVAVTRALVMAIVVQMRFATGDVILGVGFFSGLLFVERFVRKTALLAAPGPSEWAATWFAPERFLLQAPAVWVALIALGICLELSTREPLEKSSDAPRKVSRRFARSYPFATMGPLAPLDVWLPQLFRAKFRIDPVYIPRLIATLALSTINTAITLPERIVGALTPRGQLRRPPVFIVGAHRSGTTHLHNLMSIDPQFVAPTTWQVMNPFGFRFSGWLLRPFFEIFAPWKRPMDAVAFGMGSPAEDEFAIANMSGLSPDWSLRLPRCAMEYDRFGFPDRMSARDQSRWGTLHTRFARRVAGSSDHRLLLKNPHNTGRIALLMALYPNAQFVHIRRDPEEVLRSNAHLAQTAHELFQLQDPVKGMTYAERYPALYRAMEDRFYAAADTLPSDRVIDIRYQDLASRPRETLRRVYDQLNLRWTPEYETQLASYLERIAGFTRNPKSPLSASERARLERELGPLIDRWNRMDAQSASADALAEQRHPIRSA